MVQKVLLCKILDRPQLNELSRGRSPKYQVKRVSFCKTDVFRDNRESVPLER